MNNLLQIFLRYGGFLLFALLELVCLYLIVHYNQKQQAVYISSMNAFTGFVDESAESLTTHFTLSERMDSIAKENAELRELIFNQGLNAPARMDSIKNGRQQYQNIHAKVLTNTINKNHNYLKLNRGSANGIKKNSAVIDGRGIVGIVVGVAEHYSIVMSLLHRQTHISASTKHNNQKAGTLVWKSRDPFVMELENIPKYLKVAVGDTIVTSGASLMFPGDIMIGTVAEQRVPEGSNSHEIKVLLNNNIGDAKYVYVVVNLDREAILELESSK
ncbi:MAG: rod shape-determining protein MreC [Paraglaciecola sp.]|jgi:rod shape-determining protein MreC